MFFSVFRFCHSHGSQLVLLHCSCWTPTSTISTIIVVVVLSWLSIDSTFVLILMLFIMVVVAVYCVLLYFYRINYQSFFAWKLVWLSFSLSTQLVVTEAWDLLFNYLSFTHNIDSLILNFESLLHEQWEKRLQSSVRWNFSNTGK